jgi:hypothetical protein
MAKRIISENYTFTPASRQIIILNKAVRREHLLLITNVTTNTVIYNFSDTSLTASAYAVSTANNVETTTITLTFNTSSMGTTDKLSILVEEVNETFQPAEAFIDPVQKLRVSTPQSLIDTDFEYGIQPTKWETLNLMNNRPSAFYDSTAPITFTGISGTGASRIVTVTLPNTAGILANNFIYVQDAVDANACGYFVIATVTANVNFTYIAPVNITSGSIFDATKTYIFNAVPYTGAGIAVSATAGAAFARTAVNEVTVTTKDNHGLTIGDAIFVTNLTATNPPNGSYFVRRTPTSNTFIYDAASDPSGTISPTPQGSGLTVNTTVDLSGRVIAVSVNVAGANYFVGDIVQINGGNSAARVKVTAIVPSATGALFGSVNGIQINAAGGSYTAASAVGTTFLFSGGCLFVRPWGSAIHRPFDGGVYFTAGLPYPGNQLIRQTRRYFRYQSGKGIQFSTGSNMSSPFIIDTLTASGTTVTVITKFPHNQFIGAGIRVSGADQSAYNGSFTITSAPTATSFTYTALSSPSVSPASGSAGIIVQPSTWFGASVRLGMFDSQNGFFYEYDGQTLFACRRTSTFQLAGYISSLGTGENSCTGIGTRWADQLNPGDFVVIRGMSYTVQSIESHTSMTIYPDYRGTAIVPPTQLIISRTDTLRIPQSQWNIDRMDGTGDSLFALDMGKMQMWYIDYTWYGAGAIRWGFRTQRGTVTYAHRLAHGNNMTEAYMRSGNLPARYEVSTFNIFTKLSQTLLNTDTAAMTVVNTDRFPNSGTLIVSASGNINAVIEYINFTGKTANQFTGLTRAVTNASGPQGLTNAGGQPTAQTFTFSSTAPTSITYFAPQCSNTIAHWGSSVMMDGRFDDDKSLVFIAGMPSQYSGIGNGVTVPLISIRVGPSVDSGFTGVLGARELINRMQLILRSAGIQTTGANFLVTGRLNCRISGGTATSFSAAGGSSLSQVNYHASNNIVSGGEVCFGAFTSPGVNVLDLSVVRDLGTSILGGGSTLAYPGNDNNKYPDGPDVLTLCATQTSNQPTNTIIARIGWTEAQA